MVGFKVTYHNEVVDLLGTLGYLVYMDEPMTPQIQRGTVDLRPVLESILYSSFFHFLPLQL
jgi:hypothetical protein